ncbi:hypothetical protein GCM10023257_26660 [Streptomyces hyderabadensis]|uniref:Uncharacterized protein n=1 Tax=Streptomyces hyderabadensis TaxID=598549 RepID=A0ABP9I3D8_9ACTN
MQECRPREPEDDAEPVVGEQPQAGVAREREGAAEQEDLERAADPGPRHSQSVRSTHALHPRSPNVSRATHLVFSTPGAAGTMIRAG